MNTMESTSPRSAEQQKKRPEQSPDLATRAQETLRRCSTLLSTWLGAEKKQPMIIDPESSDTSLEESFFEQGVSLNGFESKMQRGVRTTTLRRLMGGLLLIGSAEALVVACDPKQHASEEAAPHAETDDALSVSYSTEQDFTQMQLPDNHTITVMDYSAPEGAPWNITFDESRELVMNNDLLAKNDAYRYHVEKFYERVNLSGHSPDEYKLTGRHTVFSKLPEAGRLDPGLNPGFDLFYGNMDLGDKELLTTEITQRWRRYAADNGWDENLNALTAHQWMQLIQLAGSELEYDFRLGSSFEQYDPELAGSVQKQPIDQLLAGGIGVCRDKERLNVASYVIADELFNLSAKGLLYYPLSNISDAKHTRGMFLVATNESDSFAIGVDTTNIVNNDITVVNGDTAPLDTTAWYLQDSGTEWLRTEQETSLFYSTFLNDHESQLRPTTRAMIAREIAATEAQLGQMSYTQFKEKSEMSAARQAAVHFTKAFQTIKHELDIERAGSTTYYLDLPVRKVHMLDGLLVVGRAIDTLRPDIVTMNTNENSIGPYYGMGLDTFAHYMADSNLSKEQIDEIRKSPESIQFNETETDKINQAVQERLRKLQETVE